MCARAPQPMHPMLGWLVAVAALPLPGRDLGTHAHRIFGKVPLFMREEDPSRLMRHPPPYGFKFQKFRMAELMRRRINATLPAHGRLFSSCAVLTAWNDVLTRYSKKGIVG